jgi:hypothetical protein
MVNCTGTGHPLVVSGHETLIVNICRTPFLVEENAIVCPSGENVGSKSLNAEFVSGEGVLEPIVSSWI